jgi:putative tryptophan/tyrosine transport system substrate-binding protein
MSVELGAKRLGLLHELIPAATRFAMLLGPTNPLVDSHMTFARTATAAIGRQIEFFNATTNREIDAAFASTVGGTTEM